MPALSIGDAVDLLKDAVNLVYATYLHANTTSPNVLGLRDAVGAENLGNYPAQVAGGSDAFVAAVSNALSIASVRAVLAGPLLEIAAAIDSPATDPNEIWADYAEYNAIQGTPQTYNSRDVTYGTPTASGSPVGTGAFYRVTVDDRGYDLEKCHMEVKTLECIADQNNLGEKHREVFRIRGVEQKPFPNLQIAGSGLDAQIAGVTSREVERWVQNPTFSQYGGTTQPSAGSPQTPTAVTSITGWTLDATTSVTVDADTTYRDLTGETKTFSVRFSVNRTIEQALVAVRRAQFDPRVPWYVQVAVYRADSCDGTLTITFGAQSQAFTVSSLNNGAWNICQLTLDKDLYQRNWTQNAVLIKFALASRTTGSIYLDDVIVAPMELIDGTFLIGVGGATPWKLTDKYTITDALAGSEAKVQFTGLMLADFDVSQPSATSAGEVITDP